MMRELVTYSTDVGFVIEAKGKRNLWAEYYDHAKYWYLEVDGYWHESNSDQIVYQIFANVLSGEPAGKAIKKADPTFRTYTEPVRCRCCNSIISYKQ